MNAISKRLKSKTYRVAILGAVLVIIEQNSSLLAQFIPAAIRPYAVLMWPLLMITLREVTTSALSDK